MYNVKDLNYIILYNVLIEIVAKQILTYQQTDKAK